MKKKTAKKDQKNIAHRGNVQEVIKNYELEMKIVRSVPKSFYSRDGGTRKLVYQE